MMSRRAVLSGGVALAACGAQAIADAGAPPEGEGWSQFSFVDLPALRERGGWAVLTRPAELLNVIVVHEADDTFAAVWRICTHGACEVEVGTGEFICPCHHSRFSLTGQVLQGPATRPLASFEAVKWGDSLFLRKRV